MEADHRQSFEVYQRLRAEPDLPHTPVPFLAPTIKPDLETQGADAATLTLRKPSNPHQLVQTVAGLLGRKANPERREAKDDLKESGQTLACTSG